MSDVMMFQSLVIVCGTVGFVGTLSFLHRYIQLRRDRPDPLAPSAVDGLHQRLARMEEIAEVTALEVERLSETNRYMARLLTERVGAPLPAGRPERIVTPH